MYRNRKRPDGSYIIHLDGEDLIITKAMMDATDPQIMREYLRMLWAQEHRERREERCRDAHGVRCQGKCSVCDKSCSGKPMSIEALTNAGVPLASGCSLEKDVEKRLESWALYSALQTLDNLSREVIQLIFFCDYTERQAASIVGISQNGVHQRKNRALQKLRKQMEAER